MIGRIVLVALFPCLLLAATANAAEATPDRCGSFSLTGGEKGIQVIDNAPAGKSTGDTRVGWRKLLDKDGKVAGEANFAATLTQPAAAGHGDVLVAQYFISFGKDWFAAQSFYELPDAADTSQGAGNSTMVVTGGTGTFEHATGTVNIKGGNPPTYVFDLHCGG